MSANQGQPYERQGDFVRSAVTLIFVVGYFLFLFTITGIVNLGGEPVDLEENPVITLLLGILSTALALIVQFYYRRGQPQ